MHDFGILALIPAAVTIIVALVWRRVALALFCGVLAGVVTASGGAPGKAATVFAEAMRASFTDLERLKIVLFVLLVGGLLETLSAGGAYRVFAREIGSHIDTPFKARMAVWGLGMCLFFDDYANVLITGASLRPITDRNRIPPAMLAYIVDVAAIMASIMLVSTWSAYEGSVMLDAARQVGVPTGMSRLFLGSVPFHFYTYIAIFLALLTALSGKWAGGRLDRHHPPLVWAHSEERPSRAGVANVLGPILTLLITAFGGIVVVGAVNLLRAGEALTLPGIFAAAPVIDVLLVSAAAACLTDVVLCRKRRMLGRKEFAKAFARGMAGLLPVCAVILLAKGFSLVSETLGAGPFIASTVLQSVSPALLPAGVFLLALAVTVATGFSWTSMAVVMPLAYQSAASSPAGLEAAIPLLSAAVITGAVAGEHVIPFSEKAVMSAAACRIPPVYHVRTMLPQTAIAVAGAAAAFVLAGAGLGPYLSCLLGGMVALAAHFLLGVAPRHDHSKA